MTINIYETLHYLISNKGNTTVKYFLPAKLAKILRSTISIAGNVQQELTVMIDATALKTTWHSLGNLAILRPLAQEFRS